MYRDPSAIAHPPASTGFRPFAALLEWLNSPYGERLAHRNEKQPLEYDIYALDDVACVRIRRR